MIMSQLGINFDPATTVIITAVVWPLIQASLDKPWWTPARRRILVALAAIIISLVMWFASAYPLQWQTLLTQVGAFLGIATAAFWALKSVKISGVDVLEWVGIVTPGGVKSIGDGDSAA